MYSATFSGTRFLSESPKKEYTLILVEETFSPEKDSETKSLPYRFIKSSCKAFSSPAEKPSLLTAASVHAERTLSGYFQVLKSESISAPTRKYISPP